MKEVKKTEFPMVSLKEVRTLIKVGHAEGWGRILEFPVNKDHSGMGYHYENMKKIMPNVVKGQVLMLPNILTSVEHLVDGKITIVEEEEDGVSIGVGLVYKRLEG